MSLLLPSTFFCKFDTCKQAERTVSAHDPSPGFSNGQQRPLSLTHRLMKPLKASCRRETPPEWFKRVCSLTPSPEHSLDVVYHNLCSDFHLVPLTLFAAAISFLILLRLRSRLLDCLYAGTLFLRFILVCCWPSLILQF